MTDAMFTFAWHALARLWTSAKLPEPADSDFSGGSPRYQLYRTKDGALVACAALEDHFWQRFLSVLGLDNSRIDDRKEPAAAKHAIATLIAAKTAPEWEPIFRRADCCVTIVRSLKDAASDPHFVSRGLFRRKISGANGQTIPALPIPIDSKFRDSPDSDRSAPPLANSTTSYARNNQIS
jgi:crotonobetainyl-CoA:carnitine CoA-transferase CaiB-like acyl-CoA transferase